MKSLPIFFLFFLSIITEASSQELVFNDYYLVDTFTTSRMKHIVVADDTIIGLSQVLVDENIWQWGVVVTRYDSSGVLLDHAVIKDDSLFHWYMVNDEYHNITKTADGGYAFTCLVTGRLSALLVKLDGNLQTEFIKEYNGGDFSRVDFAVHEAGQGYVISSSLENPEEQVVPFIWMVDGQGDILWERYYEQNFTFQSGRVTDLKVREDGKIYAIGYYTGQSFRSFIEVLDSDGTTIRSWLSQPTPEEGFLRRIVDIIGEDLLTYGWYFDELINGTYHVLPNFIRFGSELDVKLTNRLNNLTAASSGYWLSRFIKTQDGNYLGMGQRAYDFNGEVGQAGWLHCLSPMGDSIWSGIIDLPEPDYDLNRGYLNGGGVLSSGSIICGGSFVKGPESYPWLAKLNCSDSLFCGEPFVSSTFHQLLGQLEIAAKPNPAFEELTVNLPPHGKFKSLSVFDLNGHELISQTVDGRDMNLAIGHLPAGTYVLRADGERGYSTFKFIKM